MNYPLIINIAVFVGLVILLLQTRRTNWSLAKKVLAGLAVGVVLVWVYMQFTVQVLKF